MQDGYATLVPGIRIRDRTNNLCLSGGGGGLLERRGRTHKHWGWYPRSSLEETFSRSRPWLCGRGEGSATKRPARRGYGGGVCSWMVAIDGCFPICTPPVPVCVAHPFCASEPPFAPQCHAPFHAGTSSRAPRDRPKGAKMGGRLEDGSMGTRKGHEWETDRLTDPCSWAPR